jgi:hypothetical protein
MTYCWRSLFGVRCGAICHEPSERRDLGLGTRGLQQPLAKPEHVQPHQRRNMSEANPGQANMARPSQACASRPARDRALDAGAACIFRPRGLRCLPLPGCLEGLVSWLGPNSERPPRIALHRADTVCDLVAGPTIFGRELHLAHRIPTIIDSRRPARASLAHRTDGVLPVPSNLEVLGVKAGPFVSLPVIVKARGPQEIHAVALLTPDEQVGVQEASVHDMDAGQ